MTATISRLNRPSSTATAGLLLGGEAERVEVGAGQPAAAGDPVGGLELVGHVDGPVVGPRVAQARAATLAPSGIRDIDSTPQAMPTSMVPAATRSCDQVRGLLARAALGVDRGGAGALGEPGVQPGAADHVVGLLAGLGDAAADDLLDQRRGRARRGAAPRAARSRAARRGARPASQPPRLPSGVRTASTITGLPMVPQKLEHVLVSRQAKPLPKRLPSSM